MFRGSFAHCACEHAWPRAAMDLDSDDELELNDEFVAATASFAAQSAMDAAVLAAEAAAASAAAAAPAAVPASEAVCADGEEGDVGAYLLDDGALGRFEPAEVDATPAVGVGYPPGAHTHASFWAAAATAPAARFAFAELDGAVGRAEGARMGDGAGDSDSEQAAFAEAAPDDEEDDDDDTQSAPTLHEPDDSELDELQRPDILDDSTIAPLPLDMGMQAPAEVRGLLPALEEYPQAPPTLPTGIPPLPASVAPGSRVPTEALDAAARDVMAAARADFAQKGMAAEDMVSLVMAMHERMVQMEQAGDDSSGSVPPAMPAAADSNA